MAYSELDVTLDMGATMKSLLLILSIISSGSFSAFAQHSTVIGSIDRINASDITVKTPRGSFTISAGDRTETVKDKTYRGFASLKLGDEISARCEANGPGKLRAVKVWAKVVTFSATIKYINGDDIEVVTIPTSGSGREEHRIVHLHRDTAFSTRRNDLPEGQDVQVVGLEVENGTVDAARITIYNTDLPVKQ
jgi:hypothetical protein